MQNHPSVAGLRFGEVLARRRYVAIFTLLLGVAASIAAVLLIKPYYVGVAHVLLVNDQQGRDPSDEGLDLPTIATSSAILQSVHDRLKIGLSLEKFAKNVTVKVPPKSSIMTISGRDHDPTVAVAVTNAVADTFKAFYASVSGSRYRAVVERLRAELAIRKSRIVDLESRLQQAAASSSYVGSQTSLDNTANSLNDLVTQRTFAYAQFVSDRAQLHEIATEPGQMSKIVRHEMLENDQNYRQLEIAVSRDIADLAQKRAADTDQFPGLIGEKAKVASEEAALRRYAASATGGPAAYSPSLGGQIVAEQKAQAAVAGDLARVAALDDQIGKTKSDLLRVPAGGPSVGALRELRDAEEAQYQALALRLSNAQANDAEANALGSAIVIDHALSAEPSLLGPNLLLVLGLLVSLGLAAGAAYAAETLDPRLISAVDIETLYRRPVVGSITSRGMPR